MLVEFPVVYTVSFFVGNPCPMRLPTAPSPTFCDLFPPPLMYFVVHITCNISMYNVVLLSFESTYFWV